MERPRTTGTPLWALAVAFLLLTAVIITAGYFYYQSQKRIIVTDQQNNLTAIADLKIGQLVQWHNARFVHLALVLNNPMIVHRVKAILENPADKLQIRDMREWMESFRKSGLFEEMMLLNADGTEVLAAPETMQLVPTANPMIGQAIFTRKPVMTEVHMSQVMPFPHIGAAVPLTLPGAPQTVVGVFYMYASLERDLYPMLMRWPGPSRTSETLLVSREGGNVVFLNELRHRKNTGGQFKLPLNSEVIAAIAVQGKEGVIEGVDYRGVPVVAIAKKVPSLNCYMIAQTDQEEVYAALREQFWTIGIGMGILMFMSASCLGVWWWRQRSRFYLELYDERKIAAEKNSLLASIVESSDDAIIGKTLDGVITSWNRGAEKIYGYKSSEIIGKPVSILIPPEHQDEVVKFTTEIKHGGHVEHYETERLKKSGEKIFVALTISPINDSDGNIIGASTIVRDITGRKQAEQGLRRSEENLRKILDSVSVGIIIVGRDKKILQANRAALAMAGLDSEEELRGHFCYETIWTCIEKDQCPIIDPGQEVDQSERTLVHKSGKHIPVLKSIVPFKLNDQDVLLESFIDISDRKQAEAALRQSEEQLRSLNDNLEQIVTSRTAELEDARRVALSMMQDADIQRQKTEDALQQLEKSMQSLQLLSKAIENNPILVVIADRDGSIEYVNPSFVEVTGYAAEEVIGKNPRMLKSGYHPPEFYHEMWATITSGRQWRGEICNKKKNGELFWESTSITPVKDNSGENVHYVAVKEDVTERKRFIEELEKAKLSAESANRAKSLFLANMSHEIRTPMNSILGFSQLLQRDQSLTAIQKKHLETINRSGEYLLSLINDILEMSKIEAGRIVLNMGAINLHQLISELEMMFNLRAEDKGLSFSVERRDNVPQYVVADGSKLRQVLINLLSNAVKFTENGRVTLRIEMAPETEQRPRLIFEVEDTGMGIAAEEMNMLFQHFQQTQAGRKSGSGTGLGLAISREFVRLMGGEITVTSMPGKGSTFRFEVQAENGMERIIDKSSLKIPARQVLRLKPEQPLYRVLIVDDKKDNRELLSLLLDSVGFETRQSCSGADGIKDFEAWTPHLILMDMRMPEMDGVETIRRIRAMADGKKVKILSLTASTFMEDREKALSVGADDFLGKPFIEAELFEKIRDLLQVEYLYAGPEVSAGASSPMKSSAEIDAMLVSVNLPDGLISELRQAVLEGDLDRMLDIISRINSVSEELADALRALAEHFEYQKLQNILANFKK